MDSLSNRVATLLPLHEWACLRMELFWIYDRIVFAQYQQGRKEVHPGYRAWLLRKGSVSMTTAERTYTATAGSWIMTPLSPAEVKFSRDAHILSINFICQWPSGENILVGKEGLSFKSEKYPELERSATEMERQLRRQFPVEGQREQLYARQTSTFGDFLGVQGLFFHLLATWFQIEMENGARLTRLTSGDSRPFQAARCLNTAPLDRPFPVAWLQQETGLGLMRLNQLFFSEFGLTTRKYWDRRRLEFAKQCLETSPMPMKEIAYRLGFRSDSHFVIWFRRLAGARPGEYRTGYRAATEGK